MNKIQIVTDSGCDITKEDEHNYGIDIMPFQIVVDDEVFWERVDVTYEEFYKKIDAAYGIPKTSQITVLRFEEKFIECYENGIEEVIMVLINSSGSATFSNAEKALENLREDGRIGEMKVHLVDSHCYSLGYGYPVVEAAKKLRGGMTAERVVAYLTDWFNSNEIYIIGFGLRHLKKSGRVNAAAAFLGELMGLKPVISLIDGESVVVKKSRGEKAALTDAVNYISARAIPHTPWQILRTTVPELEDAFIQQMTRAMGSEPSMQSFSGGCVSSNAGTKMIGVIIKGQPRR